MKILKKTGYGLLAVLPLIGMLLLQSLTVAAVAVIFMIRMILEKGDLTELIEDQATFAVNLQSTIMDHYIQVLLVAQIVTLCVFGLWYYLAFVRKKPQVDYSELKRPRVLGSFVLLGMGGYLFVAVALNLVGMFLPDLIEQYNQLMEQSSITDLSIISTLATLIMAPVSEEIIFRGLSVRYLKKIGLPFVVVNIIQALLFSIAHLNWVQSSYAFLLGLMLGWISKKYGTIVASIILHLCFNFFGTYLATALQHLPQENPIVLGLMVIVATILFTLGVRNTRQQAEAS